VDEKHVTPTVLTPGAIERLLADRKTRSPRPLILAGRELFRGDLLIGSDAAVVRATKRHVVLRYKDPAHPSAPPVIHTVPRSLLQIRRTPPAHARRPEPLSPPFPPGTARNCHALPSQKAGE
jgi:hypothetical protein